MLLESLTIENFRAIRSMELPLDDTVVLIGENGCGKTSIFDALHACLGIRNNSGPALLFHRHDFRPLPGLSGGEPVEPIRIVLRFVEREPGECGKPSGCCLSAALLGGEDEKRGLVWEVRAGWDEASQAAEVNWGFLDAGGRALKLADGEALVKELRRRCPFLLFGQSDRHTLTVDEPEFERAERFLERSGIAGTEMEETTRELYAKLSEGWENLSQKDMRKARTAAKRIWRKLVHPKEARWRTASRNRSFHLPSGGAQSLGPLIVFGSLLRARGARPLDPDVDPVFGTEHLDAFLHPSTMGSVWQVLDSLPVQKLIVTYSGDLVSSIPLASLRRIVRRRRGTDVHSFNPSHVGKDELRRLGYHIRSRRGGALFDRTWLLVEGETEFWLLPEMARLAGYEFEAEGIGVVEFAQCGLRPIIKLARELGISWHLLADGDDAGSRYAETAAAFLDGAASGDHITQLPDGDMESYLWTAGYANVYRKASRAGGKRRHGSRDRNATVARAINTNSKPFLALSVIEACAEEDSPGIPPLIRSVIDATIRLARTN